MPPKKILSFLLLLLLSDYSWSQGYSSHTQLAQRLRKLESTYPNLVKLQSLTKTLGGKDIWVLEIGSGDRTSHPALAVVGGVEGAYPLGQELAVGFAERLLARAGTDSIKTLLASTAFYVFPNVSPDASEQFFAKVRYERSGNASPTDDDREGQTNEDPFEDLNKDGLITMVRVEDPAGTWTTHPADPRIMVLANAEKGEKGRYLLFSEGIDNDKDGKFNEDGEGGIHFNKSLTFDPPYFTLGAGEHPVSERENRAVLDYLFERFNVFSVLTLGPANNLFEPWKFDKGKTTGRVPTGIMEKDGKANKLASDLYKKHVSLKDAPPAPPQQGDFTQWAYFHYGRQSYSTPGWWSPKFVLPKDSAAAAAYKPNEDKNAEVDFIRWADKEGQDVFVPWQAISHPDFPGRKAEVGGFKPFVRHTPPAQLLEKLTQEHTAFLLSLASRKPEVELVNLKTESLDNGITRLTVHIHNRGLFPALPDIARQNNFTKLVKAQLIPAKNQEIVTGNKVVLLPNLEAGESKELSWLVRGKGTVTLEAGSPQTGIRKLEVKL